MNSRPLICILMLLMACTVTTVYAEQNQTTTVTDLAGRTVTVPADIDNVAALVGPGYEKIFLLGGIEKASIIPSFAQQMPWAMKIIPGLGSIQATNNPQDPSIEELVKLGADVVFFWDTEKPLAMMTQAGLPVVVTQPSSPESKPQSVEAFRKMIKDEVNTFAKVLGPDAEKKAAMYDQYFDEKVDRILDVTSTIPKSEYPKVYYVRGPDALTSHGKNSYTHWWVTMAGADLVSSEINEGMPKVSLEQVISWNPDIIVMGRVNSTSLILDDPNWKDITAVKEGAVYTNPEGVFYWDYSSEGVLFLEYLAKLFHPDKFADIDMKEEIKEYYSTFYDYSLTDEEAERILNHMAPA